MIQLLEIKMHKMYSHLLLRKKPTDKLKPMSNYLWGIDLGGTKIEAVLIEEASSKVVCRKRIPTEADRGYDHILNQIQKLVEDVETESELARPKRIGIGTPGVSDPATGLIRNSNTVCLIGKPLVNDLENKLGVKVIAANDANCFALAEAQLGAGRGFNLVFGVIIGTGVGGGIVVDGKVLNGRMGIAGEWGHNVLDPDGEPCYCGKRGCVETVLSGPFLERAFERKYHEVISPAEIEVGAKAGEPRCIEFLNEYAEQFGKAMSYVVNILDPDVIVLGGGVSNLEILYTKGTEGLHRWTFHEEATTPVKKAELGDSAGVFGAALLTE